MVYIKKNKKKLRPIIRIREGEKLLIDLPSLVDIRVKINLGCLDGSVTEILLDDTEVF